LRPPPGGRAGDSSASATDAPGSAPAQASRRAPILWFGVELLLRVIPRGGSRLDGSRPSFLVRNGEMDLESSPVGEWRELVELNRAGISRGLVAVGRIDRRQASQGSMALRSEYRKFKRPFPLAACVHPVPGHLATLPPAPTPEYRAFILPIRQTGSTLLMI
jgi:hypothetical protein